MKNGEKKQLMIRKIEENVNKLLLNFYDVENKTRHAVYINYADSFSVLFFFFRI
jgi:hypothetical protein